MSNLKKIDTNAYVTVQGQYAMVNEGAGLGILINRKSRQVEIYRQGKEVEVLDSPATVSGEDVFKGFVLNLGMIW
jgi:Uma2 family endonuclease